MSLRKGIGFCQQSERRINFLLFIYTFHNNTYCICTCILIYYMRNEDTYANDVKGYGTTYPCGWMAKWVCTGNTNTQRKKVK